MLAPLLAACTGPQAARIVLSHEFIAFQGAGATQQVTAQVLDQDGKLITDKQVTWSSNAAAVATVSGTGLVTAVGPGSAEVTATVQNASGKLTVTVAAGYNIELRMLTTVSPAVQNAFQAAKARWEQVIVGNLQSVPINISAGQCGSNSPPLNEVIDDLLILVTVDSIDGPGSVLGAAGPCFIRESNKLPVLGQMRLDSADLTLLAGDGRLFDVILHEMGHVIGFGTVWTHLDLLRDPAPPETNDTHFDGPRAIDAFNALGGTNYTGGAKVPVENCCGAGTRNSHWRESVFDHELMTGFLEAPGVPNPLSSMTVASLWDLSYEVNMDAADPYTRTFSLRAERDDGARLELIELPLTDPVRVVNRFGRVVREVPR